MAKKGGSPMNIKTSTLYFITGVLFCLAAVVAAFGNDFGMGVVYIALGVTFWGLAQSESKKSE